MDGDESHTVAPSGAPALTSTVAEQNGSSATPSFADVLAVELERSRPGGRCSIGTTLAKYPDPAFAAALADESVNSKALAKALHQIGYSVSEQAVRRHRRGDCLCPTS